MLRSVKYFLYSPLLFATLLFMTGCGKNGGVCLSDTGTIIRQQRNITEFDTIILRNNLNLILTQDTFCRVEVEAGKNITGGIITKVVDRQLFLSNENTCNWLRSYSKPLNVHVTVKGLAKLYYNGSGDVTSTNTLSHWLLKLDLWGGSGNIDLNVDAVNGYFALHLGTATVTLRGKCQVSYVYAGDYGLMQLKALQTKFTYAANQGSNDCYVDSDHYLDATISSVGNIYYAGGPDTLITHINGSGKVIHL